ncbi:MAG: LysR family transcriptional regulator [Burkholderiales bacterium]|nr:LysR family transcriptional regulator [Burkholderiales bacterium]
MNTPADLRFPSIDGLRAFEAAARLGTFERAADELNVTASAIGKRIGTVEELLGGALFVRSGKALALTAAGREYLQQVAPALSLFAAMPQHRRTAQRHQRLRISAPPTFARQILVPSLESFTAAHPRLELEIVLSIPFLDHEVGDADLSVRLAEPQAGGRLLMRDRLVPMAAPALLARLPPLRRPDDLRHAALLRTPLDPWTPWFRAAGLDWPEPASGPKFVDLGLTLEAAVAGQGVALARPALARHWLAAGSLRPLFASSDPSFEPARQYRLQGEPAAATGDSPERHFADWLITTCASIEAEALAVLSGRA